MGAQVTHAKEKGESVFNALARITSLVWGPLLRYSRLVYSTIVRPSMMYGSQIWSNQTDGHPLAKYLIEKTEKVQNGCLRKITGAQKRTPRVILQRENNIQSLELYTRTAPLLHNINTRDEPVTSEIQQHLDSQWEQLRRRYRPKSRATRKRSVIESIRLEAEEHISQIRT
ncbi:hypothetical protein Golomagni_01839 [Golovinomyces magnicellulatus]|nr:hypothetical protein Golomagni_01839 [Golovinomyces magnicellulatus]